MTKYLSDDGPTFKISHSLSFSKSGRRCISPKNCTAMGPCNWVSLLQGYVHPHIQLKKIKILCQNGEVGIYKCSSVV